MRSFNKSLSAPDWVSVGFDRFVVYEPERSFVHGLTIEAVHDVSITECVDGDPRSLISLLTSKSTSDLVDVGWRWSESILISIRSAASVRRSLPKYDNSKDRDHHKTHYLKFLKIESTLFSLMLTFTREDRHLVTMAVFFWTLGILIIDTRHQSSLFSRTRNRVWSLRDFEALWMILTIAALFWNCFCFSLPLHTASRLINIYLLI